MSRRRLIGAVLGTLIAVVAGAVLWNHLPVNTDTFAPFDVHGSTGEHLTSTRLSGSVEQVTIAPEAISRFGKRLTAVGTWVIVQAAVDSGNDYANAQADLVVGPNTYRPTDRVLEATVIQPGITDRRAWVFDVAPAVLAEADSVVFRVWVGDGRLDSRLVVDIPLTGPSVHRTAVFRIPAPTQAAA